MRVGGIWTIRFGRKKRIVGVRLWLYGVLKLVYLLIKRSCMHTFRIVPISSDIVDAVRKTLKSPGYGHPAHVEVCDRLWAMPFMSEHVRGRAGEADSFYL